MEMLAYFCIY